jgi:hypothetical protein
VKLFDGMKIPLAWYPAHLVTTPCPDRFVYMFSASARNASKKPPFDATQLALLRQLGDLMGNGGSRIPSTTLASAESIT